MARGSDEEEAGRHGEGKALLDANGSSNTTAVYATTETARNNRSSSINSSSSSSKNKRLLERRRRSSSATSLGDSSSSMSPWKIVCILSTAASYGCIMSTLFMLVLPTECDRIHVYLHETGLLWEIPSSVALGLFVAVSGATQLIAPIIGRVSDIYVPPGMTEPDHHENDSTTAGLPLVGQRMPYMFFGSFLTIVGLLGCWYCSLQNAWLGYVFFFTAVSMGLNIIYAMMIALIPDQVPSHQTGIANGVLAMLLVSGSLAGFGLFNLALHAEMGRMYGLYTTFLVITTFLTVAFAHDKDVLVSMERILEHKQSQRCIRGMSFVLRLPSMDSIGHHVSENDNGNEDENDNDNNNDKEQDDDEVVIAEALQQQETTTRQGAGCNLFFVCRAWTWSCLVLHSMWYPFVRTVTHGPSLMKTFTLDIHQHWDFFIVTISRLFYYCGMSAQTFFLYFLKDVVGVQDQPEAWVAYLAILGQCSGAASTGPTGLMSDLCCGGRRVPFVVVACGLLGFTTAAMIGARTVKDMVYLSLLLGFANGIYLTMETSLAVDALRSSIPSKNRRAKSSRESNSTADAENSTSQQPVRDRDEKTRDDKDNQVNDDDEADDFGPSGSAQLLGIWGVAGFCGTALGPMIGGPLLYVFGRIPLTIVGDDDNGYNSTSSGQQDDESHQSYGVLGYAVVLTLSSTYFLCSALSLRFLTKNRR